ncbi:carbon-nitrogen hydrolase [Trichoderma austrokoningii]
MRIGCLQFAPQVGDVDNNLNRADAVLSKANPENLDILVLPEMAFSGYNFKSLQEIAPFLEPSGSGITSLWARTMALKYNCAVVAGYPEMVDVSPDSPTGPEYYSSAIVVNGDGETIANYRKAFLYDTDESWALEGDHGFYDGYIPGLGNTAIGFGMDMNPYKLEAPWHAFEFAFHVLEAASNLVIVTMSWVTREDRRHFSRMPNEPDMDTLTYWITRLEPLIRSNNEEEIIVVFCNRTGTEDQVTYAGTSAVIGIHEGEVKVYGLLGRGAKDLLVVDTNKRPYAKLLNRPQDRNGVFAASSLKLTPLAVRPPRLIIPQSPRILSPQQEDDVASATSYKSARSLHSVKSNDSEASVQTIRANPRPPEESTPYPDSSLPLSGYPLSSLRSDYGGQFAAVPHDLDDVTPITPFEDVSPITPLRGWPSFDDTAGGWAPSTPVGRKSEPFPWADIKTTIPESSEDEGGSDDNVGASAGSFKDALIGSSNDATGSSRDATGPYKDAQSPRSNTPTTKSKSSDEKAQENSIEEHIPRPASPKSRNASRPASQRPCQSRDASQRRPSYSSPDALGVVLQSTSSDTQIPASPDAQDKATRSISRGRQPTRNFTNATEQVAAERASSADSTKNATLHTRVARRNSGQAKDARNPSRSHDEASHDEHVHIRSVANESGGMRVEVVSCPGCPDHGRRSASSHSHDASKRESDSTGRRRRRGSKAASEGARSERSARSTKDKSEVVYNQFGRTRPAAPLTISTDKALRVRPTYDPSTPRAMIYIPSDASVRRK